MVSSMPSTHPLTLPRSLLLPGANAPDGYSAFRHLAADFSPSGDHYLLSHLVQHSAGGTHMSWIQLVSRHRPDGTLSACAVLGRRTEHQGRKSSSGVRPYVSDLCVLPNGTLALSSEQNRTFLVDANLTTLLGSWQGEYPSGPYGYELDVAAHLETSFATAIRTTPSGRLLCVVSEFMGRSSSGRPNLLGLSEDAPTPEHRPTIEVFACLHTFEETRPIPSDSEDGSPLTPYTRHHGTPAGRGNRPSPGIVAAARARWSELGRQVRAKTFRPYLEAYAVVADDLFVVPVFDDWRPNRHSAYAYTLVDDTGALVGRLDGPGTDDRSPHPGENEAVAADPAHGRIFHLNRSGLYVWSSNGTPLTMLPASDKAYRPLKHLKLLGCGPEGDLLLLRPEHGLLTRVEVPEDLDRLGDAVTAAMTDHTRRRTRLKKQMSPSERLWTHEDVPVFL